MVFRLGLYVLAAAASTANAINVMGFPSTTCSGCCITGIWKETSLVGLPLLVNGNYQYKASEANSNRNVN
ncbi:hypothetical protein N7453_005870 [Penicillium expansum]|nr:hypothetical protein N7453_005870 [Penicillium expansum]